MLRFTVSNIYGRLSGSLRAARIALAPTVFKLLSRFVRFGALPVSAIPIIYGILPTSRLFTAPFVSAKEFESPPPSSLSPSSSSPHSSTPAKTADDSILRKKKSRLIDLVDAHNSRDDHVAVKRLLTEFRAEETDDPRLLWRYSRTLYELSASNSASDDTGTSSRDSLLEAFRFANRAVAAVVIAAAKGNPSESAAAAAGKNNNKNNDGAAEAHLWYAIILEALGKWKTLREKIADSFVVKDHYLKSLQLKPQSAIVLHCLGSWCYTIASVNWFERKLAHYTSQDLPVSTYEEALGYFRAAEEVSPHFYSLNLLFIAKCYIQLRNEVKADEYLERVVNFAPIRSKEDENAVKEAQRLLRED